MSVDPRHELLLNAVTRREVLRRAMAGGMVLSAGGLLAACGSDSSKTGAGASDGTPATSNKSTVRYAIGGPVRSIDPDGADQNYIPSQAIMWACYDTLVSYELPAELEEAKAATAKGLEPKPLLAESWESSKDGKVWRFKLRQGVVSNYGNPLTPESVSFMVKKTMAAKASGTFFFGLSGITSPKQIKEIGDDTVQFTLPAPSTLFLLSMGTMWFFPYDTVELKKHATAKDPYGSKWLTKNTAGFGPYKVQEIGTGGNVAKLVAHDKYWGEKPIPSLIQQNVPDKASRLQLLLSGDTDYAEDLSPQDLDTVEKRGQGVKHFTSTTGLFLGLTKEPPWDDPSVRQAFAKAIPYEDILKTAYLGRGEVWKSHFVPWMQGYTADYGYSYDPAAAKEGLAPVAGESLTFSYSDTSTTAEQALLLIQGTLKDAGVNIKLQKVPRATYAEQLNATHEIQNFADTLHTPIFATPWYVLFVYFGKGGFLNWSGYENPDLEVILKQLADPSTPPDKVMELSAQGQKITMGDIPIMPVISSGEYRAVAKGLEIPKSHTANGLVFYGDVRWS
jgi:peptide/nickel transport system substrate-binding protein